MSNHGGLLVLVSTPIGNLGDLPPRAVSTLGAADLVCCEDTRRTRELLSHAGVRGRNLLSLHGHNEASRVEQVLARLAAGETVAVVSDAGTPTISDPGARLVARAVEAGIEVRAVPGPSAALAALVVSGLATDRFCFEGFLPRKGADRKRRLGELRDEQRTVVLYEAPGRLAGTFCDLVEACGEARQVAVARELTKLHEEVWRGSLGEAAQRFAEGEVRGEVVIVLGAAERSTTSTVGDEELRDSLRRRLLAGQSVRDAATAAAEELGVARRHAYEVAVSQRDVRGPREGMKDETEGLTR
ncbi:MAG TPA: 16S rRNA (cytidine(1402)-2'-O)-methyltransferase [Acidimicrobiales bacterium]|nr:16S rRNA (cytidine(1402)-2'-O)-methyltransferase [Acidimicrobiales bacterium]